MMRSLILFAVGCSSALATDTNLAARAPRLLAEPEVRELVTAALQENFVHAGNELELRFQRPWPSLSVTDAVVSVHILELPATGINPNFILRFELRGAGRVLGSYQLPVQAKLWNKVWVARAALTPTRALSEEDVAQERRDLLALREPCWAGALDGTFEVAAYVPAGTPLYVRSVRARPVVHRGQAAEARCLQGALEISLQVEVLEEGAPGQVIRVRNPRSLKEFRGKVQDEHTIVVLL